MLELCEYVCTEDEKASMAGNNSLEEEELVLFASSIEKKALMKMWDFECKNGMLEYDEKTKKGWSVKEANLSCHRGLCKKVQAETCQTLWNDGLQSRKAV